MHYVERTIESFVLPVHKFGTEPHVDLSILAKLADGDSSNVSYHLVPSQDDGLSYLRLATHIYSQLVVIGKPCLDVVIVRREPDSGRLEGDLSANAEMSYSDTSPDTACTYFPCASEGYRFGDGSPEFYDKYYVVAVGGTFDRLHAGHRLLLTAAAWAANATLRIGITGDVLLQNKKYKEFIAPYQERRESARRFARSVKPTLRCITGTELRDAAGPTASDPFIDALVVSSETASSAKKINSAREKIGLRPMALIEVDVLNTHGEKLSSTALREADSQRVGDVLTRSPA